MRLLHSEQMLKMLMEKVKKKYVDFLQSPSVFFPQITQHIFFLDLLFIGSHCLQGQVQLFCTFFCFFNEFPRTSPWEAESLESSVSLFLSLSIQMSPQNDLEVQSMYLCIL